MSTSIPVAGMTPDDVSFVRSISDGAIHARRIHELFVKVFFNDEDNAADGDDGDDQQDGDGGSFGASDIDASDDEGGAMDAVAGDGRFVTAAAEAEREEMRRELRELQGEGGSSDSEGEPEPEDDILDMDNITEQDEREQEEERQRLGRGGDLDVDPEFIQWLGDSDDDDDEGAADDDEVVDEATAAARRAQRAAGVAPQPVAPTPQEIELELTRVGLGSNAQAFIDTPLPERLHEIAVEERRPQLGAYLASEGVGVGVNVDLEAQWILYKLSEPGMPLNGNASLALDLKEAAEGRRDLARDPRVSAIRDVLYLMTKKHLEPAHIMLYHQSTISPLLDALWHDEALRELKTAAVSPSLAVCNTTGRRLMPIMTTEGNGEGDPVYIGFERRIERKNKIIGAGDKAWGDTEGTGDISIRKPCVIELGRLLWTILDLDSMCHSFERSRQQALVRLNEIVNISDAALLGSSSPSSEPAVSAPTVALLRRAVSALSAEQIYQPFVHVAWGDFSSFVASGFGLGSNAILPSANANRVAGEGNGSADAVAAPSLLNAGSPFKRAASSLSFTQPLRQGSFEASMGSAALERTTSSSIGGGAGLSNSMLGSALRNRFFHGKLNLNEFLRLMTLYATDPLDVNDSAMFPNANVSSSAQRPKSSFSIPTYQRVTTSPENFFAENSDIRAIATAMANRGSNNTNKMSTSFSQDDVINNNGHGVAAAEKTMMNPLQLLVACRKSYAEVLSYFPALRVAVFNKYAEEGLFDVKPIGSLNGTDMLPSSSSASLSQTVSVPLRNLLFDDPSVLVPFLSDERRNRVRFSVKLPDNAIAEAIRFDELVTKNAIMNGPHRDAWFKEFELLKRETIQRLRVNVERHVIQRVRVAVEHAVTRRCLSNFGSMCQEGPWEPVDIRLEAYHDGTTAWDEFWNIVESLPAPSSHRALKHSSNRKGSIPICGVYRADSGTTYFALLDEDGALKSRVEWRSFATNSGPGKEQHTRQVDQFKLLVERDTPEVIAVVASRQGAAELFSQISRIVREELNPKLGTNIQVAWCAPEVALVLSRLTNDGTVDINVKVASSAARFTQDPLIALARCLFHENAASQLPLGIDLASLSALHQSRIYAALRRELSLWVTAEGLDINRLLLQPAPHEVLSFVAGLGPHKARRLVDIIHANGHAVRSRMHLYRLIYNGISGPEVDLPSLTGGYRSDAVATNASNCLRVRDSGVECANDEQRDWEKVWSPLDETMIPLAWYSIAAKFADETMRHELGAAASLVELLYGPSSDYATRLRSLDKSVTAFEIRQELEGFSEMIRKQRNYMRQDPIAEVKAQRERDDITPLLDMPGAAARWAVRMEMTEIFRREAEFVIDELSHAWEPHMRRTYRAITQRRLFRLLTGVSYVSRRLLETKGCVFSSSNGQNRGAGGGRSSRFDIEDVEIAMRALGINQSGGVGGGSGGGGGDNILVEGQMLQLSIKNIIATDMTRGLSLSTTMNVDAVMDTRDISNESITSAIDDYAAKLADSRANPQPGYVRPPAPEALKKGATVYGRLIGIDVRKGELKVSWIQAPPPAMLRSAAMGSNGYSGQQQQGSRYGSSASSVGGLSRLDDARSIRSDMYLQATAPNALSANQHALFRNRNIDGIEHDLAGARIGAALFVPDAYEVKKDPKNGWSKFLCVAKVGLRAFMHFRLTETRLSNGRSQFVFQNPIDGSTSEFADLDQFIQEHVDKITKKVILLRNSPWFAPSYDAATTRLARELRADGSSSSSSSGGIAMCFAEVEREEDKRYRCPYVALFSFAEKPDDVGVVPFFVDAQRGVVSGGQEGCFAMRVRRKSADGLEERKETVRLLAVEHLRKEVMNKIRQYRKSISRKSAVEPSRKKRTRGQY